MRVLGKAGLLAASLLNPLVSSLAAQSILVEVVAFESGTPISGAFVTLLGEDGGLVRSALTGRPGRTLFSASGPGVFQVKAEMVGRETKFSSPFPLGEGEFGQVSLSLSVDAIPLAGILVEADQRCRLRPDEASGIARVWEEARKALAVQAWTEQEGLYRLAVSTYERTLDSTARRVEKETRNGTTLETRTPFVSLPPEELMNEGFVRPLEGGGHQYYGPDAPVLLSDPFLDTHCFRLARDGDLPGSIGLEFEPVRGEDFPDIQGRLWLDEETGKLQFLEFGYTWAPYAEAQGAAGGRVEFEAMPNGAWIIDRWWIRAPILAREPTLVGGGDSGIRVSGILESGGEVTGISTLDRERISEAERGAMSGEVWDSTRSEPLEGATVFLSGTQYSAVTDAEGHFLAEGIPGGVFAASFTHPRLESLGLQALGGEVTITDGEVSELHLGIPSMETILGASCSTEERERGSGILSGSVRDQASGEPVPGARVRLHWQELRGTNPTRRATEGWFEVGTNAEGKYTACGIPRTELIRVKASFLRTESTAIELDLSDEGFQTSDLEIELRPGVFSSGPRALNAVQENGVQGVQGVLVESGSGSPIRSAEVSLHDGFGRIQVTELTNDRGFFRLQAPIPGKYILSARALGYGTLEDAVVDVTMGQLAVLEVQLAPDALELEALVVTADRRVFNLETEGFYDRQIQGLHNGIFLTPELLERRQPRKVSDLFFGMAGTRVMEPASGSGSRAVYFRSGERFRSVCWPMVYVDRHLISTGGLGGGANATAVDDAVHGLDVSAVEVYRSAAQIPPEFNGPNAGCGVIVIWTHRGGGG